MNEPIIQKELAEYLEKLFPSFIPHPSQNEKEIFFKCGQVSVAQHIRNLYEKQREKYAILDNSAISVTKFKKS